MTSKTELYSDLDLNLTPHPVTGDIVLKRGVDAIRQSFTNLIYTNFFERPYNSDLGANLIAHLFEQFSPITSKLLQKSIDRVADNDEPRVRLLKLVIKNQEDENRLIVQITFQARNFTQPVVVDVFLRRVR